MRHHTGGVSGGSCYDDSNPQRYDSNKPNPEFEVLDIVLGILAPNISYLNYKKISGLLHTNQETEWEYYGNSVDFEITYVVISDLIKLLKTFK